MNKKIFFLIFFIFLINFDIIFFNNFFAQKNIFAMENNLVFAKVEKPGTYFFSSPVDTQENFVFEIPQTYFVELVGNAGDQQDIFYSAKYMDVFGYVKKSDVVPVQGTPLKPFASEINFRVFALSGLELKSTPSNQTPFNNLVNVPYLSSNLVYYGPISGEAMIPEKSDVWYYCKFLSGNSVYYGYLYSALCDKLSTIPQNSEVLPVFEGQLFAPQPAPILTENPIDSMAPEVKIVAIFAICLPCLLLVYLLFKPTKIMAESGTESPKKKIKRLKHSEFYELDD